MIYNLKRSIFDGYILLVSCLIFCFKEKMLLDKLEKMEQPEILGPGILGCAVATAGGFAVLNAAYFSGGIIAVGEVCLLPAVATFSGVGFIF